MKFLLLYFCMVIAAEHRFVLGFYIGVCLIKFCLRVNGFSYSINLIGTCDFELSCFYIINYNAFVGVYNIDTGTVGVHDDIPFDNIHRLVIDFHRGRLNRSVVFVSALLYVLGDFLALVLHGI